MWNLAAPAGFRGFDPLRPVRRYTRHLPHWRQQGATYFVTFRLADSLPAFQLRYFRAVRREWERTHPEENRSDEEWQKFALAISDRYEEWLDRGKGGCWLRRPEHAKIVADAMQHFDNDRYCLGSYVVMPNHVHVIVRPEGTDDALEKILQSWKRHTAQQINACLKRSGEVWMEESYDRIIRDEEHLDHFRTRHGGHGEERRRKHGAFSRFFPLLRVLRVSVVNSLHVFF